MRTHFVLAPHRSPEEVVERLEFLEDDRLGSFDQLLRTQEEVASLQVGAGSGAGAVWALNPSTACVQPALQ